MALQPSAKVTYSPPSRPHQSDNTHLLTLPPKLTTLSHRRNRPLRPPNPPLGPPSPRKNPQSLHPPPNPARPRHRNCQKPRPGGHILADDPRQRARLRRRPRRPVLPLIPAIRVATRRVRHWQEPGERGSSGDSET